MKFLLSLRVANKIRELTAESVVVLAVIVDLALLLAATSQVVDELTLSVVKASAHALSQVSHGIEFLHALAVVLG